MEMERFAGRLAELRTKAGMTQQHLAEMAGLTRDGVAHLEGGRRAPSWETVLAICTALGVSCEAFRVEPADTAKKRPGRPKKSTADAAGTNVEEQAADAPRAKMGRKAKGK
jgi:DNA-binding XRE family transcriptional regulator